MPEISLFVEAAATRGNEPKYEEILAYCERSSFSTEFFCNEFSVYVANGFSEGKLSYEFCDSAMNYLWGFITTPPVFGADKDIPEPAFAIFQAFDAGEYQHPSDSSEVDPVEKYTRPMITEILRGIIFS